MAERKSDAVERLKPGDEALLSELEALLARAFELYAEPS